MARPSRRMDALPPDRSRDRADRRPAHRRPLADPAAARDPRQQKSALTKGRETWLWTEPDRAHIIRAAFKGGKPASFRKRHLERCFSDSGYVESGQGLGKRVGSS